MKPPPPEVLRAMNAIVNNGNLRDMQITHELLLVSGLLSIPDEHYQQMCAAAENEREPMKIESHAKTVCLYRAVTESITAFRAEIRHRLARAGFPAADMPQWV